MGQRTRDIHPDRGPAAVAARSNEASSKLPAFAPSKLPSRQLTPAAASMATACRHHMALLLLMLAVGGEGCAGSSAPPPAAHVPTIVAKPEGVSCTTLPLIADALVPRPVQHGTPILIRTTPGRKAGGEISMAHCSGCAPGVLRRRALLSDWVLQPCAHAGRW